LSYNRNIPKVFLVACLTVILTGFCFSIGKGLVESKKCQDKYGQEFQRNANLYDENRRLKTAIKDLETQNSRLKYSLEIEEALKDSYRRDKEYYMTNKQ
jgi:cell division protein FtsB